LNIYLLYDTAASAVPANSASVGAASVLAALFPGIGDRLQPNEPPARPGNGSTPIAVTGGS